MAKEKVFTLPNNEPHNQTELAESYDITKQTMNNYMRMADMIPELESSKSKTRSQRIIHFVDFSYYTFTICEYTILNSNRRNI